MGIVRVGGLALPPPALLSSPCLLGPLNLAAPSLCFLMASFFLPHESIQSSLHKAGGLLKSTHDLYPKKGTGETIQSSGYLSQHETHSQVMALPGFLGKHLSPLSFLSTPGICRVSGRRKREASASGS